MGGLIVVLVAIFVAESVGGGLSGEASYGNRTWWAVGCGTTCSLVVATALGLPVVVLGSYALVGLSAWCFLRGATEAARDGGRPRRRSAFALATLGLMLVGAVMGGARWQGDVPEIVEEWLRASPFEPLNESDPMSFLLLAAVALFLTAPANAIVREVLRAAGTDTQRSEKRLRGGRIIGVLERWMIFGLAMSGELTAAALVVSAKSLLRFPEISRTGAEASNGHDVAEVDVVTEYFLLGSLTSWMVSLAPVLLLR